MKTGGIVGFIVVLLVGMVSIPAVGFHEEAAVQDMLVVMCETPIEDEVISVVFWDHTGLVPVKVEQELLRSEWLMLRSELRDIRQSDLSLEESLEAQFTVFQKYGFLSEDVAMDRLMVSLQNRLERSRLSRMFRDINRLQLLNNSNFNAMCVINFELINGTTFVFGLNTFINLIGFDIISIHKGYAVDGIETKGLFSKTTEAGEYGGVMFGFFGAWIGDQTSTGFYSNVTVAGFTVITGWVSLPLFQS